MHTAITYFLIGLKKQTHLVNFEVGTANNKIQIVKLK
jgi:hypothetical protein